MESSTAPSSQETPISASAWLKAFVERRVVVVGVSILCLCAAVLFLIVALYFLHRGFIFWMWCNLFWAVYLVAASILVQWLGIQRTLALSLLLVSLIFMGTAGVWVQLNNPIVAGFNIFWMIVCMVAAFMINPRRS